MIARMISRATGSQRPMAVTAEVTLRINGEEHALDARHAHHAARRCCASTSASPAPRRAATTASAARARCCSTAGASTAASRSPSPTTAPRSPPIEGLADGRRAAPAPAGLHRARRVPVRLLHARPDLLGGRRCSTRSRAGWPSAVTADVAGDGAALDARRDPRAHERQPLPLRRLREHRRRDRARRRA